MTDSKSSNTTSDAGAAIMGLPLATGISRLNGWSLVVVSFFSIGLLVFVTVGTNYVLGANLHLPREEFGTINGDLVVWTEIIQILMFGAVGVAADRIGRRPIFIIGMLVMATAYFLYPFSSSVGELTLYRVIYAVGIGAAIGMLGTIVADYPKESSRGRMVAVVGIMNGLGVVVITVVFGKILPAVLLSKGMDPIWAGRAMHWAVVGLCLLNVLVIRFGLKGGTPTKRHERPHIKTLLRSGLAHGKNPRIALAYASAFVARSDLVVTGTFTVVWGTVAAHNQGFGPGEAAGMGAMIFVTVQTAALLWAPIMGFILDRINRVTGIAFCMSLAGIGYTSTMFVGDPLASSATPFFIMLGIGQMSAFFGATTLIGQEAPLAERGSVVGMFNVVGAIGIILSSIIGGRLFDAIAPWAPFVMIGIVNGLIALAGVVVRRTDPGPIPEEPRRVWRQMKARIRNFAS